MQLLKQLEKNSLQRDPEILSQLGESQWRMGHLPAARSSFALARNNDPHLISRMDVYAHVLVANGRNVDMNRWAREGRRMSDHHLATHGGCALTSPPSFLLPPSSFLLPPTNLNRLCQDLLSRGKDRIEAWVSMARFCQLLCENETDPGATRQHARRGLGFIEKVVRWGWKAVRWRGASVKHRLIPHIMLPRKASEMSSNNVEMLMVKGE